MLLADKMGLEGFEYKYLALGDYIGFGGLCTFISSMLVRQKVRERYGIPGSAGGDCIISCCCTAGYASITYSRSGQSSIADDGVGDWLLGGVVADAAVPGCGALPRPRHALLLGGGV